jgi:hypothetical protein
MEIYHRQGHLTRFTSARCDDPQDAQKVSFNGTYGAIVLR